MGGSELETVIWSSDQKSLYVAYSKSGVWKWNLDDSTSKKLSENCAGLSDSDPNGNYLLGTIIAGEKTGIYELSVVDGKCTPLLKGVETYNATFTHDGKSFFYPVVSRGQVLIYRQQWAAGKLVGSQQIAVTVPFAFPLTYRGNAYDISRDLSTLVYARNEVHADLYLLSQK